LVNRVTVACDGRRKSLAGLLLCAQHGRTLTGASPVTSWSQ
jgi:hypothetical protein